MKQTWNSVDFFRYEHGYEDVFVEDGQYLYVCAEPFDWCYLFACTPYDVTEDGSLIRYDSSGADIAYLKTLVPAPDKIAKRIIKNDNERALRIIEGEVPDE